MDTQKELNNMWIVAAKEFRDNITSKRFILMGILFLGVALLITGVTVAVYGLESDSILSIGFQPSEVLKNIDSLNFLWILFVVVITADMVSAEKKDRTIYQLLSKPVERSTIILGKFIGYMGIISFLFIVSSILAYLLTAVLTGVYPSGSNVVSALEAIAIMLILFAVYTAIGVLISTATRNPIISILSAVTVWIVLFFSNMIGNMIYMFAPATPTVQVLDRFDLYPIYAKIMVWIAPQSYDVTGPFLNGAASNVGLPLWGNVVIMVVFSCLLLLVSIELFNRQDI